MNEANYMVCARITGLTRVPVSAVSFADAQRKANITVAEMDFGPLEDIDWHATHVEAVRKEDNEKENYAVCVHITGRVQVSVSALSITDAYKQADAGVSEMDLKALREIDWTIVYVEDENDNRTYYE